MLKEKELILATRKYANEFRNVSWFHMLSTLCILGMTYVLIFWCPLMPLNIIFSVLIGLTMVRLFIIYHDYLHRAILQKSLFANAVFTLYGLYILAPVNIWRRSHDYHHTHNSKLYASSIGSFPIVTREKFLAFTKGEQALYLFIRHPLTIMFGYLFAFIYGMCILSFYRNPGKHWDSVIALLFHFGIGAMIFTLSGWQIFILAFLLPALVSSAIGSYLFYAQHNFPGVTFKDKDGWTYANAAFNSSSFMKLGPVMNWFTANIGYHHIHHVNARIPFYRLPEVYNKMPEFQEAKTTSLLPGEIIKCLRLKVWDPDSNKMIAMKDIYT